jgi:hypothetical protein
MFNACYSLIKLPALNLNSVTNSSYNLSLNSCYSLKSAPFINIKRTISFYQCNLSRDEIVKIFNNLTTQTGQSIDVRYNQGSSSLTPADIAIATGKGWSVNY